MAARPCPLAPGPLEDYATQSTHSSRAWPSAAGSVTTCRPASVLRLRFVGNIGRGRRGSRRRSWSTRTAWDPGSRSRSRRACRSRGRARWYGPPLQQLGGELGEPALDLIEPRGAGRDEVHMKPRVRDQPAPDRVGLVSCVVVGTNRQGRPVRSASQAATASSRPAPLTRPSAAGRPGAGAGGPCCAGPAGRARSR
jgi:hypothetical protein